MTIKEILLAAGLVIVSILCIQQCHNNQLKSDYAKAISVSDTANFKLKAYVDINGQLNARVQAIEVDKGAYIATHQREIDSMAKALNIKSKNINSITTIGTENNGSVKTVLDTNVKIITRISGRDTLHDTISFFTFRYDKDKWLHFDGLIDSGNVVINYNFKDSLILVGITKHTGFLGLGPSKTFVNIKSENPNTSYNSLKNIELTTLKKQHWSVGPYIGYGYNGNNWSPNVGLSLQFSLIKF